MKRLYIAFDITCDIMSCRFTEIKDTIYQEIEKFRKGALNPKKAMSIENLELSPKIKIFLRTSPRFLGVFVEVDGKYYLSEERLRRVEEQLLSRPLRQWLRHTASVPKGLLRFYVFRLLKERAMSGSDIIEEINKKTSGQWKPSPGSVYPRLNRLRDNGYTEELPKDETGMKRYSLTEKGKKFFDGHTNFEKKLQKKIDSMGPLYFLQMTDINRS